MVIIVIISEIARQTRVFRCVLNACGTGSLDDSVDNFVFRFRILDQTPITITWTVGYVKTFLGGDYCTSPFHYFKFRAPTVNFIVKSQSLVLRNRTTHQGQRHLLQTVAYSIYVHTSVNRYSTRFYAREAALTLE